MLNLYVNPSDGGTIFELDYKPKSYNLLNTLTRWPEAYHNDEDIDKEEIMVDRYKKNMLRLRFFQKETSFKMLETDQYKEFGSFVDGVFNVIRNEKDRTSAILEIEKIGNVNVPTSNEDYPCSIFKIIKVEESQIAITIRCKFDKILGKEDSLKEILNSLYLGVDLPFFFNGEPSKFQWECNQNNFLDRDLNQLLKPFEFTGHNFKAYDASYNLNLEFSFNDQSKTNNDSIKIYKFPIIAYAFTDEGYKKIYQGINLLPRFQLKNDFEFTTKIKIF